MKKRITAALLSLALFLSAVCVSVPGLVPASALEGFTLTENSRFYIVSSVSPCQTLSETVLLAAHEFAEAGKPSETPLAVVWGPESAARAGDVIIAPLSVGGHEDYSVKSDGKNVTVFYGVPEKTPYYPEGDFGGVLFGLRAVLKQLISAGGDVCTLNDVSFSPDTKERTVMLDCARKYWTVGWIKNLIAEMSWMGYNSLELHLTEEQGIRCNIWRDSEGRFVSDKNGNDFSWICGYTAVSWNQNYADPEGDRFYYRDEIAEIVNFAKLYHIEIIPSVDFPGHSYNLITRFRELYAERGFAFSFKGVRYSKASATGNIRAAGSSDSCIDVSADYARYLSYAIADAYADFFGSFGCGKFNIGSDEVSVSDNDWLSFARANGGSTQFDAFILYINGLTQLIKDDGYTVRAFNDYIYSDTSVFALDEDLEICWWAASKTSAGQVESMVKAGRTLYNCSGSYCYYPLRNNSVWGDARDKSCAQWNFHHGTAERIYSGCGGKCGFSLCRNSGGWNPSRFMLYDTVCTEVTGDSLGGGYYLIWGDWAGWDTEENIFLRNDDYSLVNRMWSSSAKMLDFDCDANIPFSLFSENVSDIRFYPGFTAVTDSPFDSPDIFSVAPAVSVLRGDADGDGKVTASDARFCLRAAVGLERCPMGSQSYSACDTDSDGCLTAGDARTILRISVGLE